MNWIWRGVLFLLVVTFQCTLTNYLGGFGVKPDFILIVVVLFGLSKGPLEGEISGFLGGLLEDILSAGPLGINALIKTTIGYLSGIIKRKIYPENIISGLIIFTGSTLIDNSLMILIKHLIYAKPQVDIWIFPFEALYNALWGVLILQILTRWSGVKE